MFERRPIDIFALVAAASLALSAPACKSAGGTNGAETPDETASTSTSSDKSSKESATKAAESGATHRHGSHTAEHAEGHARHHEFDEPEKYAEDWNSEARDDWQKPTEVVEILGAEPGETVVDLGTGTGYFLPHLSRAVGPDGTVLALDVSEKMLAFVDKQVVAKAPHDNVETRLVKRDDPGLAAGSVDHVLMVNVWHHVQDRVAYAEKLYQALVPGGTFVDVDYTMETERGPPKKIRLEPEEVVEELQRAGFRAEVVDAPLPKQYVVVATKPE